jgi:hypothetical protein
MEKITSFISEWFPILLVSLLIIIWFGTAFISAIRAEKKDNKASKELKEFNNVVDNGILARRIAKEEYETNRMLAQMDFVVAHASGSIFVPNYSEAYQDVSGTVEIFNPYHYPVLERNQKQIEFKSYKRCSYCFTKIFDVDRFCVACGAPL